MLYVVLLDYGDTDGTGHPMLVTKHLEKALRVSEKYQVEIWKVDEDQFYEDGLWENVIGHKEKET